MTNRTKIFFVDDDRVVRTCLRHFLKKFEDFEIVGEAEDGSSAIASMLSLKPALALVDIGLPHLNGIEVTRKIKASLPDCKILMLTSSDDARDIFASLDAGADGYVLKGDLAANLEIAIRSVRVGAVWLDPGIARIVLDSSAQRQAQGNVSLSGMLSTDEAELLGKVAGADCQDGVCLVDPAFLKRLRRLSTSTELA
ncbi:MAG: response regulator transcription factor [Leptolyngbya sp.]|nr:response regulator transcription factor [Candidatus Melainabacteria bacterium]